MREGARESGVGLFLLMNMFRMLLRAQEYAGKEERLLEIEGEERVAFSISGNKYY